MKFRRSIKIVLLIELIILNLILRFPILLHEQGVDSFAVHMFAGSISNFGYAKWLIHPASLIGLYPLSTPSGAPVLLSGISQSTGINIEFTILMYAFILGILGIFSMYLLAKELFDNDLFVFLSAFIFSISPLFISYTHWNATTRGIFITLLPLFVWALMKTANTLKLRYVIPAFLFLILLATIHRMFILIIPFVVVAFAFGILTAKFEIQGKSINAPYVVKLFIFIFLFLGLFVLQFTGKGLQPPSPEYFTSSLFQGSSPVIILLNIGVNYATGITPLLIFLPIGVLALFSKAAKEAGVERFLLLISLLILLLISNKQYGRTFSLLFICILVAYSLSILISKLKRRKKVVCGFLIFVLLATTVFSAGIPIYRASFSSPESKSEPFQMTEYTYNLGLFMKNHTTNNVKTVSNSEIIGERVTAISETSYNFPAGPTVLICDIVSKEELKIEQLTLAEFIPNPRIFWRLYDWLYEGSYYVARHKYALERHHDSEIEKNIFKVYGFEYLIERKGSRSYRSLVERTHKNADKAYDNGFESLWHLKDFMVWD